MAVHGRTRACRYAGDVDYDMIAAVVDAVNIPVFANGDVDDCQKAAWVLKKTQAYGLMIGRAAQGQPWLFSQLNAYLNNEPVVLMSQAEEIKILIDHVSALHAFYGEGLGLRIARKHVKWMILAYRHQDAFSDDRHEFWLAFARVITAEDHLFLLHQWLGRCQQTI